LINVCILLYQGDPKSDPLNPLSDPPPKPPLGHSPAGDPCVEPILDRQHPGQD